MDTGEPLTRYLHTRLRVLFRRRYAKHWRDFNVFLDGAAISKNQTPAKTPTHFETWLTGPTITDFPVWATCGSAPPPKSEKHWGIYYTVKHHGYPPVKTAGYVMIVNHLVRVYSSSWADNRLATSKRDSWTFELADPDCIEKVVGLFKRMFAQPQVRK